MFSLLKLDILIKEYLQLAAAIMLLFLYVTGVLLFYGMRRKRSNLRRVRRIIGLVLCVIMTAGCVYGAILFFRVDQAKNSIIATDDSDIRAVVGVYVGKDDAAQSLADIGGYRVGVLAEWGNEKINSDYAVEAINKETKKDVEAISYPGISDAASAMRSGEIQALAVNGIYISLLEEMDAYKDFDSEVRRIAEISVPNSASPENNASVSGGSTTVSGGKISAGTAVEATPRPTPAPFNEDRTLVFFISGVDKFDAHDTITHSDVNILMFVNPNTRQVLLINTPRDTFMMNPALGGEDKLTHCGIQGAYNSMAALELFYGVSIDNYVKVNFTGFETFIDSIGGIKLNNPMPFQNNLRTHYFEAGEITLDGEAALVYARERQAFGDGDLARGRNQMRVITAVINKIKASGTSLIMDYPKIISAMGECFETDLSSEQMSYLVKLATKYLSDWDIKSYGMIGVNGMRACASSGSEPMYIIWPIQNSVDFATDLIRMINNNEIITDEILAEAPMA